MKISVSVWVARPIADVAGAGTPRQHHGVERRLPAVALPQSRVDLRVVGVLPPHGGAGWQHGV